jgi:FMN phosphatase YigB (HAD superfamily)
VNRLNFHEECASPLNGDALSPMTTRVPVVFLVDVDNTLLDNDAVLEDMRLHMQGEFGDAFWDRYWAILMSLWNELGYRDYLGAMQRFRLENPHDPNLLRLSFFLSDYLFADRLYPYALNVIHRLRGLGPVVIVSDGDVVFQPLKVRRSGIWDAVDGNVLIYVHKERELDDIARWYPSESYVLIDDKLAILTACKRIWRKRVTTVFPRQGRYAFDPAILDTNPPADITVERIGDLLTYDASTFLAAA